MIPIFLIAVPHQIPAKALGWARNVKDLIELAEDEVADDDRSDFHNQLDAAKNEAEEAEICLEVIGHDFHALMRVESIREEYKQQEKARRANPSRQLFHQQDKVISILANELRS